MLGTIEATLDGETRTWYVLEGVLSGKQEYGAIWYVLEGQEEATAVFTGYDASDVPFETFEVDRETRTIDYGDYDGSIMTIMFDFPPDGSGERTFSIPQDHDASVVYVSDVSGGMTIESLYGLEQGAVTVTHIEASRTGTSQFAGTFSGTLVKPDQNVSMAITDGRFEISQAHYEDGEGSSNRPEGTLYLSSVRVHDTLERAQRTHARKTQDVTTSDVGQAKEQVKDDLAEQRAEGEITSSEENLASTMTDAMPEGDFTHRALSGVGSEAAMDNWGSAYIRLGNVTIQFSGKTDGEDQLDPALAAEVGRRIVANLKALNPGG